MQPGQHLNGEYVTTFRMGQIGKILKTFFNGGTYSALLQIFETAIDDPRVLTYTPDFICLVTEVDVIYFLIDKVDEEIHLSTENFSAFITVCTVAERDLEAELSSSDENVDDELVFSPRSTRREGRIIQLFASHYE